jgi:hypothetical protein
MATAVQMKAGKETNWPRGTPYMEPGKAREILRYFLSHPGAVDTLEGIAYWRLVADGSEYQDIDATAEAVAWLVSEGYLKVASTPHSSRTYSLNAEESTRATMFLDERPGAIKPGRG